MPLALAVQKWLLVEYKDAFKLYSEYLEKKNQNPHNSLSVYVKDSLVLIH